MNSYVLPVYGHNWNALRVRTGALSFVDAHDVPIAPPRPYGAWTRDNHFIFELQTRTEIETWLSVSPPHFPPEVQEHICSWIATPSKAPSFERASRG